METTTDNLTILENGEEFFPTNEQFETVTHMVYFCYECKTYHVLLEHEEEFKIIANNW